MKTILHLVFAASLLIPFAAAQTASKAPVPPYLSEAEANKPLPKTQSPANFTKPQTVRAYKIAEEIPRVLAQLPCYCWCSREGHSSLHDCYVGNHAVECTICQREAFLAYKLNKQGKTAAEIRAAIERGDWVTAE